MAALKVSTVTGAGQYAPDAAAGLHAAAVAASASSPRPSTGARAREPDLEHGGITTLDFWHCTSNVQKKGGHNVRAAQSKSAEVLLVVAKESVLTGHESQHGQKKGRGPGVPTARRWGEGGVLQKHGSIGTPQTVTEEEKRAASAAPALHHRRRTATTRAQYVPRCAHLACAHCTI